MEKIDFSTSQIDAIVDRYYRQKLNAATAPACHSALAIKEVICKLYDHMELPTPSVVAMESPRQLMYASSLIQGCQRENLVAFNRWATECLDRMQFAILHQCTREVVNRISQCLTISLRHETRNLAEKLPRFIRLVEFAATMDFEQPDKHSADKLKKQLLVHHQGGGIKLAAESDARLDQYLSGRASEYLMTDGAMMFDLSWGPWMLSCMVAFAEIAAELGVEFKSLDRKIFDLLCQLSRGAHAFVFYKRVCLLSESPVRFRLKGDPTAPHCDNGPVLTYADGLEVYGWKGIAVPPVTILLETTLELIERERNSEVRRVLVERYGLGRYIQDTNAELVMEDECGLLYKVEQEGDEPILVVQVTNSTADEDGTYKKYFLRVPPETRSPREGVAWTFALDADDYAPDCET